MRKIITIGLLLGHWLMAQAQSDLTEVETEPVNITNATEMANHLRSQYGLAKAVYLTQVAQQLSQSFASVEQLQQQWLQALDTDIEDPVSYTQINTHALMAQALIQHTNGMTLNRWRQVDIPVGYQLQPLSTAINDAQTFYAWLHLNQYWQQILVTGKQNNLVEWLPWLSLTETETTDITVSKPEIQPSFSYVLNELHQAKNLSHELINQMAQETGYFDAKSTALLRQQLHLDNQQPLAFAYDWIELYQLVELSSELLTAEEQTQLSAMIEQAVNFWQTNEASIRLIDDGLFDLLQNLLAELPNKFKNPDHFNLGLNNQVFALITAVNNPAIYFGHPLRSEIQENLEVCLNLSVNQRPEPPLPIASNQFESCLNEFLQWAKELSSSGTMAGNLIKLDNANSINRAVELPSVQIINNLTMQAAAEIGCQQQLTVKSNWVEWLMAAESVAWFHDRWPGLMAASSSDQRIDQLINTGLNIQQYPDCVIQAKPLAAQFELLNTKWERLKQEISNHIEQYTATELKPNSDVDLFKSIDQDTSYIPDNFVIEPCDVTQSCGAFVTLEPSKELLNLFPNHLILAEQFGIGELAICYDQVHWENRKSTPTHLDNNKIANFEGQLYLRLNGKFDDQTVFTKPLLSDERHIYLFGENNQETLDLSCPLPIVGKQINTSLDRGTFGLLPNRLTFLTAQKIDINAVIRSNWSDWQTQLNDDNNSAGLINDMNGMKATLNDAFLRHVNDLQQQIYRKLITNNSSRTNDSALSKAAFEFLTHRKLLTHMTQGLYPYHYASNVGIRQALSGGERLVDMDYFRQAFQQQTNVADMMVLGDENFTMHSTVWETQPLDQSIILSTLTQLQQILNFTETQ